MPKAVRFRRYGGPEVLEVVEVERPTPAAGQVLVEVVAAALNPGEIGIREGEFADIWPARFPEGQGNDLAGVVVGVGVGVGVGRSVADFAEGDEVIGFAPRAAHAQFVLVGSDALVAKPTGLEWEQAACIAGVGATAWAAVEAVDPRPGETIVVSAAAGGVGVIAAQLARLRGARVIGTAGSANFDFLRAFGIQPVSYGPGLSGRIAAAAPEGVDAYLDNFGDHDVEVALALGVEPARINTIADGDAVRRHGVRNHAQENAASPRLWGRIADLAASGKLVIPIAGSYDLAQVRQAYRDVASRHGSGKRVLRIRP
ncbi:MAG TPA: NADP-dependent oxidoreductase [Pseudonocardia sp.]|jgi:NADPH:quinone reductase-like Zn-dependent oxidoreductase|nr:NADP-dependent oxidoreductase [Pseudonocardia sp.]